MSSSSSSSFGNSKCAECQGEISGIKNWKTIGFVCVRVLLCNNEPLLFKNCLLMISPCTLWLSMEQVQLYRKGSTYGGGEKTQDQTRRCRCTSDSLLVYLFQTSTGQRSCTVQYLFLSDAVSYICCVVRLHTN